MSNAFDFVCMVFILFVVFFILEDVLGMRIWSIEWLNVMKRGDPRWGVVVGCNLV